MVVAPALTPFSAAINLSETANPMVTGCAGSVEFMSLINSGDVVLIGFGSMVGMSPCTVTTE